MNVTDTMILDLGRTAMITGLKMAAPILIASMVSGVIVSIVLAATQIQEFTLTFIPKIVAVAVTILIVGPMMFRMLADFTSRLLVGLPNMVP
jgi:flagellar biosynthetic protein FliQ